MRAKVRSHDRLSVWRGFTHSSAHRPYDKELQFADSESVEPCLPEGRARCAATALAHDTNNYGLRHIGRRELDRIILPPCFLRKRC